MSCPRSLGGKSNGTHRITATHGASHRHRHGGGGGTSDASASLNFVDPRIVLSPTITTAQRYVPNDSATVTVGNSQGDLAGNVVFKLYDNPTCSGTALYDSGNVSIASGTGSGANRTVSSSNTTAYTVSKTFSWLVTYTSSNTRHNDAISVCDDEHSTMNIDNNHITP